MPASSQSIIRSFEVNRSRVSDAMAAMAITNRPHLEIALPAIAELPEDWFIVTYANIVEEGDPNVFRSWIFWVWLLLFSFGAFFISKLVDPTLFDPFASEPALVAPEHRLWVVIGGFLVACFLASLMAHYEIGKDREKKNTKRFEAVVTIWKHVQADNPALSSSTKSDASSAFDVPPQA